MFQLLVNHIVKDFKGQVEMESLEGHCRGLMTLHIENFQNLILKSVFLCIFGQLKRTLSVPLGNIQGEPKNCTVFFRVCNSHVAIFSIVLLHRNCAKNI